MGDRSLNGSDVPITLGLVPHVYSCACFKLFTKQVFTCLRYNSLSFTICTSLSLLLRTQPTHSVYPKYYPVQCTQDGLFIRTACQISKSARQTDEIPPTHNWLASHHHHHCCICICLHNFYFCCHLTHVKVQHCDMRGIDDRHQGGHYQRLAWIQDTRNRGVIIVIAADIWLGRM